MKWVWLALCVYSVVIFFNYTEPYDVPPGYINYARFSPLPFACFFGWRAWSGFDLDRKVNEAEQARKKAEEKD